MNRREVLKRSAAIGAAASVAGCIGSADVLGGGGSSLSASDTGIETIDTSCMGADAAETADITFVSNGAEVEGTIRTSNPCHKAVVDEARVTGDGTLEISISAEPEGSQACQQCVGAVTYRGQFSVSQDDDLAAATVLHDGDEVASAQR